ncbi:MAG: hypothetical protein IJY04_06755 [Clostridia bacterium]|nr:hypothetical protein [Clostridia bacterium]
MQNLHHGLLFIDETLESTFGIDTTLDLKLDALLPEGTTEFLRVRPTKEGLLLRRELFSALLRDRENAKAAINSLRELMLDAQEAFEALDSAVCDNAKYYIFSEFTTRMTSLYRAAAVPKPYGKLYGRFSGYFEAQISDTRFSELCRRLETVNEAKQRIGALDLDADGDRIKLSRQKQGTMLRKVLDCIEKYGITVTEKTQKPLVIQKAIIDATAKLYPVEFAEFTAFYNDFSDMFTPNIFESIPQITLVLGIMDLVERAEAAGVPYCFPELSSAKEIKLYDVYDVALLLKEGTKIVPNDVYFNSKEPFFYLTGANGGGKTTYLRALGNAMTLFLFGAPVFCRAGEACILDSIHTHFPKDERFEGSGRFADEQARVNEILSACIDSEGRGNSLILLNETYSTTNEEKATVCTSELAHTLYESGNFGLYITHQHGVDEKTVPFLGVLVDESDRNRRTYRIERRRLNNRSFAADILIKYGITRDGLKDILLKQES